MSRSYDPRSDPSDLFDRDRGFGGYGAPHHGDQRPFGGYGSDAGRGPHAGRGPRGYQRPDASIREGVCERLTLHGEIDASDVEVLVREGEVTLRGTVPDRHMKRLAESVTEGVFGVKDVLNELTLPFSASRSRATRE